MLQAERDALYHKFWSLLKVRSRGKIDLFEQARLKQRHWLYTSAGKDNIFLAYLVAVEGWTAVEIYIDTGDRAQNKALFAALYAQRDRLEADFGEPLDWQRLDHKRASRITRRFDGGGLSAVDQWEALQDRLIEAMIRLDHAFRPCIEVI